MSPAPPADRLSRMIARLTAQRDCLAWAAAAIRELDGPVLEIGLGKGRTFDFLRTQLPGREIYAFDREVHCPDDVRPTDERLLLGDFRESLAGAVDRLGRTAALAHADIGSDRRDRDAALAATIAPLIGRLVQPGFVLTDRAMADQGWQEVPTPAATDWEYFVYRVG